MVPIMLARARISKGGKISIPSSCRKYLNIKDGEEIIFNLKEGEVVIYPVKLALQKARRIVNKYHNPNESLVEKLIEERRIEANNE